MARFGHAQLTEAVRFASGWEGSACLAVRAGEVSALGVYDVHGRLRGGGYEEMAGQAVRACPAEYLAGTDVLLTAFEHRECFELSRRVQEYPPERGKLRPGAAAPLNGGAHAYAGDLVVARRNDNSFQAGDPGHILANGDLLRVEVVGGYDLTVSGLVRPGQDGNGQGWPVPFTGTRAYAREHCGLGYALAWYMVQGQTVSAGIAVAGEPARACTWPCRGVRGVTRCTPALARESPPAA